MLIGIGITILWLFFEYLEFKPVYNYFKENNKKILKEEHPDIYALEYPDEV